MLARQLKEPFVEVIAMGFLAKVYCGPAAVAAFDQFEKERNEAPEAVIEDAQELRKSLRALRLGLVESAKLDLFPMALVKS
jgi:hypothetical protein